MIDAVFQALFSFRPVVFQQGELRFDPSAAVLAAAFGAAAFAATLISYRAGAPRGRPRDRVVLLALRSTTIVLLVFCLFRPVMAVRAAVPQQNFVGVLLDDSRSMQIADQDGLPRGAFVRDRFAAPDATIVTALSERFVVRTFRFSSAAARLGGAGDLTFNGAQTKLRAALEAAREELAGLPVAALVLVSDGADTSDASLSEALMALRAEALPVFTVGVGQESRSRDVQIDRVSTPRSVLKGTSLLVDLVITQAGYDGRTVTVDVEDEGRIVGSQEVRLPGDGGPATASVRVIAAEPGPRVLRFRVASQPGELVTQNNVREALVDVRDAREKILYFEGEPRWELKFIRRAVADDRNLQVVALQRTADNKYLRLDVDDPDELLAGFPRTREELFAYRGLILGSIEAGAFTGDQLRMIAEFVDRRGGGLLMLGGPRAFAEGGYAGTPLADALPVLLESGSRAGGGGPLRLKVAPTRAGAVHAATQIAASEAASATRWRDLPEVSSVNAVSEVKPGATVLLNGTDAGGRSHPVLAFHRYGRGKALAFTPQDSWLWQMHASIPVEDQVHENYWRQLLRWLVDGVPQTLQITTVVDRAEPGEPVTIEAEVVDRTFVELNDARLTARVTAPSGDAVDLPLQWTGERAGHYRGTFPTGAAGLYQIAAEGTRAGEPIGAAAAHVRAAEGDAEYFDATMQAARLRRIAEETGGRFYAAADAAGLAQDVRYTGRGVTTIEEHDLWQMPIVLAALVALICGEWAYRRAVGLA